MKGKLQIRDARIKKQAHNLTLFAPTCQTNTPIPESNPFTSNKQIQMNIFVTNEEIKAVWCEFCIKVMSTVASCQTHTIKRSQTATRIFDA